MHTTNKFIWFSDIHVPPFDDSRNKGKLVNKAVFSECYKINEKVLKHIYQERNNDTVTGKNSETIRRAEVLKEINK